MIQLLTYNITTTNDFFHKMNKINDNMPNVRKNQMIHIEYN
jgi:hypothetical protein